MSSLVLGSLPKEVLLHSCCAPCSAAILEWLQQNGVRPTIFFYNPNIYPVKEYLIRKNELDRFAQSLGIRVIDGDYRHDLWRLAVIGLEKEPEKVVNVNFFRFLFYNFPSGILLIIVL